MPVSLLLPRYSGRSLLDTDEATILIGWYTFAVHFISGFYFLDIYRGSNSDWVISPIFEYSGASQHKLALILSVYSFLFLIVGSLSLIRGVKTSTRIYYFPWLILTFIELVLIFYHVFCLVWKYSYDAHTLLIAVILFLFASYHTHMYQVVMSNYRYLKQLQNPTLIFPDA